KNCIFSKRNSSSEKAKVAEEIAFLNNARSMASLHSSAPDASVFRSLRPGVSPQIGSEERSYITAGLSRIPSAVRTQDGRYPETQRSAPTRAPPPQLSSPTGTMSFMPFPSPQPPSSQAPFASEELSSTPRRQTASQEASRAISTLNSQQFSRPSTVYEEASTTSAVRDIADDDSYPSFSPVWRPRSDSASAAYQTLAPMASDYRRASDSSTTGDDSFDFQLPYSLVEPSHNQSWSPISRSNNRRDTSDSASVTGTISSGVSGITIRPRSASGDVEEGDSNNTAKASEFSSQIRAMIEQGEGTARPSPDMPQEENDKEEATLFYLVDPIASPVPLTGKPTIETALLRPNLKLNTSTVSEDKLPIRPSSTPSDSATESESESRISRARSFARPKDQPEQWHVRPEPEQLYEHLDNFFPKIDLDRPILESGPSTPSTPAAESPSRLETAQPPPTHPSRLPPTPTASPRSADQPRPLPPPLHPSRAAGFGDRRKSIRVVVDHKRRTIQRESRNVEFNRDAYAVRQDARRLDRRKSSSMWGHRIQEVTPSKLVNGQVPSMIPESPSVDGKPTILTWVKGELIGKGSYGRVYIALNVTTGDMMAVKQVELPATERDRNDRRQLGMIEALQSEIALLQDLYHSNIVAYLGCETSPEYLSIFLEYVPGGTIASIYRTPNQARFEEQLVNFFTAQILEGLAYLHAKHIWHRDLKGDNILVDAAGVCKISDFGISKQTSDAYDSFGQATNMKGSVFWMAPEVIHSASERTYSGKVDIWSLGCVVLEMWSGKRPWGEMEQVAAMFELFNKRARPPLPPEVHLSETALDFMNNRCLAKDPRDRPMARDLLQHPFITNVDSSWTFAASKIGKAVARKAPKSINAVAP
ncbi:MAG: hypothetical protein TREMPRED_004049, partial [Tremellales sp. Tagirdzhanova-0007]